MAPAYVLLVLATIVWGASFVVIKRAVADFPPLTFLGWRFTLAALAMLPLVLRRRARPTAAAWRGGAAMGVWLALGYLGQTFGLRVTSVSNSGFLTGLYVVFTPLLAWAAGRGRPSGLVAAAAVAATVGLALLSGASPAAARPGDLMTVGCAAAFSVHFIVGERHAPRHPIAALNFVQFAVAGAACLAAGFAVEGLPLPTAAAWRAIAFTAVACTVFGFGAQTYAQSRLPATTVALAVVLEAPFAALFGRWLEGERLGAGGLAGAALIFAACVAVAASARASARRR